MRDPPSFFAETMKLLLILFNERFRSAVDARDLASNIC
jgi:hypothetical protein